MLDHLHHCGLCEEEIRKFYEALEETIAQCKFQEVVIVMRNLNVGNKPEGNVVGKYGHRINEEKDGLSGA